ncbi:transposase [Pleurocapsales cyanobacterium LEGE 06147]|nr:transposase [Pleurocapsales cyanobacterium LEGE 06147]
MLLNPARTSTSCHKCLHIGNRSGKRFSCVNPVCLWKGDSDRNGAENLATLGRTLATPGGSGLACKLVFGDVSYFQLSLLSDDLGLLKS